MPVNAPRSKIARLPYKLREALNMRMLDGEEGAALLDWLNGQPEVAEQINAQNLSTWRNNQYAAWLMDRRKVEAITNKAEFCYRVADAGGADITDGTVAIAGGLLYDLINETDHIDPDDPDAVGRVQGLIDSLTKLQTSGAKSRQARVAEAGLAQKARQLDQRERELNLSEQKFHLMVAEKIMEAARSPEVQAILGNSALNHSEKLGSLVHLMFGDQVPDNYPTSQK